MTESRQVRLKRVGTALKCKRKDCFLYDFKTGYCTALVYDRNGYGYDDGECPFFKTHLQQQAAVDIAQKRQRELFGRVLDGPLSKETTESEEDEPEE